MYIYLVLFYIYIYMVVTYIQTTERSSNITSSSSDHIINFNNIPCLENSMKSFSIYNNENYSNY